MSQGLPNGYVRLYDEAGNPVMVRQDQAGEYTLAVTDKRVEQLLEQGTRQTALLRGIFFLLATATGLAVSEDEFLKG